MTIPARASTTSPADAAIQVMVVDDSAVVRGLLVRTLEGDRRIRVVAKADNGETAIRAIAAQPVDVVVLDIEMPVMDGLAALPRLLAARPGVQVLVASTLTRRNADVSLRALTAGAADYITKPTAGALTNADVFKRELIAKVTGLAEARRLRRLRPAIAPPVSKRPSLLPLRSVPVPFATVGNAPLAVEAIAIGSSTGGPRALFRLLADLRGLKLPVFLTQHMPPTFTSILAEHIERSTGWRAAEAKDGEPVTAGRVYVAPGDFHMIVERSGAGHAVRLNQASPENFCRPAVDPMFRSVAASYGSAILAIVLTGMGQDGLKGGRVLVQAGGTLIAQDEATSVVWGMPGAVANAGLCRAVLPLGEIGPQVLRLVSGGRK